jgi:hypothetical protein
MSPFVTELLRNENIGFMVNGTFYPYYYLLVDGIYPFRVLWKPYMNPKTKSISICPNARRSTKRC